MTKNLNLQVRVCKEIIFIIKTDLKVRLQWISNLKTTCLCFKTNKIKTCQRKIKIQPLLFKIQDKGLIIIKIVQIINQIKSLITIKITKNRANSFTFLNNKIIKVIRIKIFICSMNRIIIAYKINKDMITNMYIKNIFFRFLKNKIKNISIKKNMKLKKNNQIYSLSQNKLIPLKIIVSIMNYWKLLNLRTKKVKVKKRNYQKLNKKKKKSYLKDKKLMKKNNN